MWNKIYFVGLALSISVMVILTYLSHSWLQSVTKPADVITNYSQFAGYYWNYLLISSIVLLVLGNVLLWIKGSVWALWASLAYFSVFVLIQTWWLNTVFLDYQKTNNLSDTAFSFWGFGGALFCVIGAVAIFFDQFFVLRLRDRMYPVNKPDDGGILLETKPHSEI